MTSQSLKMTRKCLTVIFILKFLYHRRLELQKMFHRRLEFTKSTKLEKFKNWTKFSFVFSIDKFSFGVFFCQYQIVVLHPNLIQKSTRDRLGWLGSSRKTQGPHTFRLALLKFIVHLVLKGIESYLLTAVEFDPHNDQFFQDKLLCFDALLFFIILWGV